VKDKILEAIKKHAEGNVAKAKANVDIFLENPVGVGTHGDVLETITSEVKKISDNEEIIKTLETHYFGE
tara:strand:+ start:71 stop:277 length:207 start_codon:yes stop_codon:yes gene_type:complete